MRRTELDTKDVLTRNYRVYKGYTVRTRSRTVIMEQHFVVPWEMPRDDTKKVHD